jgi:ribosomal protein L7/L12
MLTELRCTRCNAPLDPSDARVVRCRYCGASLVVQEAPAGGAPAGERKETYAVSLGVVGPSNRAGIADLIVRHAGLALDDAVALVARVPCDVIVWDDHRRADALRRALVEGGASAKLTTRVVVLPVPAVLPPVGVFLEDAGQAKLVVIRVIRERMDIGLVEAKHLVENAPCTLVEELEGGRAVALRDALNAAGARARTTPTA